MGQIDPQLATLVHALNKMVDELGSATPRMADTESIMPTAEDQIDLDQVALRRAQHIFAERRARERNMPECASLFGEPGWDMLLFLYLTTRRGEETSVSSAAYASAVPPTTALRCLRDMEKSGLVRRWPDAFDGRRTLVELTQQGLTAIERFLLQRFARDTRKPS
ncbi:winged helix DNA-binding protein [Sphingomonas aracearum]|uniref:HTH marR-type domain-containing protein n=1 Tax=Sphingomonas aracearum TaxID=2283317 RepID=A0A369VTT9_9SPHN|nr:winged helix DNA-binding protein [Sphingomonas aracearum]RDE05778.1 hypothetical protein DVW87_11300 [Sphingomonas aracearum]